MRKLWILLGYSTGRHNRKREQKQDLQLLRCPLVMLVFMTTVGGQFSSDKEAWIRMSGTKIEWASAARTSATELGFRGEATAWGTWYTQYTLLSHVIGSTAMPITLQLSFQVLWSVEKHTSNLGHILTPRITNPMRKLWVIPSKKCGVLYYVLEFPLTEKSGKPFWKLGYSTLRNAEGL